MNHLLVVLSRFQIRAFITGYILNTKSGLHFFLRMCLDGSFLSQGVPEALMKAGAVYKYDLSIPVEKMYDLVDEMRIRMGKQAYNFFQRYMFGMEFSSQ